MAAIYRGTIQLEGDSNKLPAVVTVDDGRIIISSNQQPIGDWPVKGSGFQRIDQGIVLSVEDGRLLMQVEDMDSLADAVGMRADSKRQRKLRERPQASDQPAEPETPKKERASAREVADKVADDLTPIVSEVREGIQKIPVDRNILVGGAVLLVLAFVFPSVSVIILTIVGALAVLGGAIGLLEPTLEHRFPPPLTPIRVLAAGFAAFVLVALILLVR